MKGMTMNDVSWASVLSGPSFATEQAGRRTVERVPSLGSDPERSGGHVRGAE